MQILIKLSLIIVCSVYKMINCGIPESEFNTYLLVMNEKLFQLFSILI